ncbi:MAG: ABC-F family ATP-binding cassette domain-containing protein [Dehalococcoidia bacterium]|nr:ABC-F family ATP-binding cassette domain-containing protein [Dehalococcoidia bacterium]
MLSLLNVAKSYAQRCLFSGVTFNVEDRDRMALLGVNGSGKSTLLGIIADEVSADEGTLTCRKGLTIGYLKQVSAKGTTTGLLAAITASASVNTLKQRILSVQEELSENSDLGKQRQLMLELGDLQHRFEAVGGYNLEQEARVILFGLGFREADFNKAVADFSGGWRMRAELAKILLQSPDLLLLDEPTNHLDLDTQIWFEGYLKTYRGAVLLTSHDRAFLNSVVERVLAIERNKLTIYSGNYDDYVISKQQEIESVKATAQRQHLKIIQEERFINRFRYKATKASQVQSRIKKLDKTKRAEVPRVIRKMAFKFPEPPHSGSDIITLEHLSKSYEENVIYHDLNLHLRRGDRVAIIGANGAGKTTLLKIMAGILPFERGERRLGQSVSCAYYAQHQLELLNIHNSVLAELRGVAPPNMEDLSLRTILGGFLFPGEDVFKLVEVLSGGEKARLALAKMLLEPANFLLLDEPTNHLDIVSREILTDALEEYKGTLCFITHDRTLIRQLADTIIEVKNGQITCFRGDYDSYLYHKENQSDGTCQPDKAFVAESGGPINLRQKRVRIGELRNTYYVKSTPLNRLLTGIEKEITESEREIKHLEECFADPEHYVNSQDVVDSIERHRQLKTRITTLTDEWGKLALEAEELRLSFEKELQELECGGD